VYWSPGGLGGLVTLLRTAFTSKAPAAWTGVVTVHVVVDVHFTDLSEALAVPNLNTVVPAPRANPVPVPVTVTVIPPAAVPTLGLRPVTSV
jgi:hypothetical protein